MEHREIGGYISHNVLVILPRVWDTERLVVISVIIISVIMVIIPRVRQKEIGGYVSHNGYHT